MSLAAWPVVDTQGTLCGHYRHSPECSQPFASLDKSLLLDAFFEIKPQDGPCQVEATGGKVGG